MVTSFPGTRPLRLLASRAPAQRFIWLLFRLGLAPRCAVLYLYGTCPWARKGGSRARESLQLAVILSEYHAVPERVGFGRAPLRTVGGGSAGLSRDFAVGASRRDVGSAPAGYTGKSASHVKCRRAGQVRARRTGHGEKGQKITFPCSTSACLAVGGCCDTQARLSSRTSAAPSLHRSAVHGLTYRPVSASCKWALFRREKSRSTAGPFHWVGAQSGGFQRRIIIWSAFIYRRIWAAELRPQAA